MAAPAFGTIGTKLNFTGTAQAVPVPAGVSPGDIIVVYLHVNSATATITARPTGFAAAENSPAVNAGGVAGEIHIEWKRATAADSGTYSFTMSASVNSYGYAVRYIGCIPTGNPWDSPTAKADSSPTNVSTAPAVSITTLGSDRLLCYTSSSDNGAAGTWTPAAGFAERAGGVSNSKVEVSDKAQVVQGGSGTVQCTTTATFATMNAWLGALIGDSPAMAQPQAMFPLFAGSPLRMPFQAPSFDVVPPAAAVTVPNFLQDPPSRTRRVSPPRLRRAGQPTPAAATLPPDLTPGASPARPHVWMRRRARLAVPPPVQVVPVDSDQLQRPRRRPVPTRSRSAQPLPAQVAAPTNPVFVPAGIGHRLRVALRRGRFTAAPAVQVAPPEFDQQRRRTALRVRSRAAQLVPPQFNPPLAPQPLAHRIRVGFRRPRPVVLPMAQESSPPVPSRRRWQVARVRSRAGQPVPPQFNPPIVPLTVGHRLRAAVRVRSRSAQPVVSQVAAPTNPLFISVGIVRRVKVAVRRTRPASVPVADQQPPAVTTGHRRPVKARRGATASPVPAQINPPWIPSAFTRKLRPVLRRGDGRTATPTPTQQTAPTNPAWVPSLLRKVRPALRRGVGRSASPIPVQQAAPVNPAFVFVDVRKVRALLVRRSETATHIPSQPSAPAVGHTGPAPVVPVRRGRSAQPPIIQTQPPTPPGIQNRQRRRLLVWQRRGKDAWRELGQAVAPVVQFFQGVITGGTRPGPSSYGGTLPGPSAVGGLSQGAGLVGTGVADRLAGQQVTGLGVTGTAQPGPTTAGKVGAGSTIIGANSNSKVTGATKPGAQTVGHLLLGTVDFYSDTYSDTYPGGEGTTELGVTGEQQDSKLTGGSR